MKPSWSSRLQSQVDASTLELIILSQVGEMIISICDPNNHAARALKSQTARARACKSLSATTQGDSTQATLLQV